MLKDIVMFMIIVSVIVAWVCTFVVVFYDQPLSVGMAWALALILIFFFAAVLYKGYQMGVFDDACLRYGDCVQERNN